MPFSKNGMSACRHQINLKKFKKNHAQFVKKIFNWYGITIRMDWYPMCKQ